MSQETGRERRVREGRRGLRDATRRIVLGTPLIAPLVRFVLRLCRRAAFPGSGAYWEARYAGGGTSGAGSYEEAGDRKARVLNRFVRENDVRSVIDFGCGDGAQLSLAEYPSYIGLDISETAIETCRRRFEGDTRKRFIVHDPEASAGGETPLQAELAISLDVVYHLVEDRVFERYMRQLFDAARRFVIIYSSNEEARSRAPHVRHRAFSRWVEANIRGWRPLGKLPMEGPPRRDPPDAPPVEFHAYGKS